MAEKKGLNVREGRTYLDVQSAKGTISFMAPAFGSGTYANVGNQINEAGLEQPTMAQTTHLVHGAWQNPKEKYSKDIIGKMRSNWLWGFNGLLYAPNEGIYIQDGPEIRDGRVFIDQSDLIKRLENDPNVRFVPFGSFKRESQTSLELAKNPFIQALVGEEGADKLAQVADKYKAKPFVCTIDKSIVSEPTTRVPSLGSYRDIVGDGLDVVGGWYGYDYGCAFGRKK